MICRPTLSFGRDDKRPDLVIGRVAYGSSVKIVGADGGRGFGFGFESGLRSGFDLFD